jgi:hypothetical protein
MTPTTRHRTRPARQCPGRGQAARRARNLALVAAGPPVARPHPGVEHPLHDRNHHHGARHRPIHRLLHHRRNHRRAAAHRPRPDRHHPHQRPITDHRRPARRNQHDTQQGDTATKSKARPNRTGRQRSPGRIDKNQCLRSRARGPSRDRPVRPPAVVESPADQMRVSAGSRAAAAITCAASRGVSAGAPPSQRATGGPSSSVESTSRVNTAGADAGKTTDPFVDTDPFSESLSCFGQSRGRPRRARPSGAPGR